MPDPEWIKKTCIVSAALALPAAVLLVSVYGSRSRVTAKRERMPFAFWSALIVLGLFLVSVPNILLSDSRPYRSNQFLYEQGVAFMVGWPLAGIVLSCMGMALNRSAHPEERRRLVIANMFLLITSLASIVAPN